MIKAIEKLPGKNAQVVMIGKELEDLQELVGGYIEFYDLTDTISIMVNEEGKLMGLPFNFYVDQMLCRYPERIVGNAYIVAIDNEGDLRSLTDEEVEDYIDMF